MSFLGVKMQNLTYDLTTSRKIDFFILSPESIVVMKNTSRGEL